MAKRTTAKTDQAAIMPILMEVLNEELAAAVIEHRDMKKEPLTEYAAKLQVKEYIASGDPCAAAEMQILRRWTAIKASWFINELRKDQRQLSTGRRTIADAASDYNARYGDFNAAFGLSSIERH